MTGTPIERGSANFWNRSQISRIMIEAAQIALKYYDAPSVSIKSDGSIVTQADREIEHLFQSHFDRPAHGCYLLGEERAAEHDWEYFAAGLRHDMMIVDPIDGTVPYANHIPNWGISIGWAHEGRLLEGAVYLPVTGELFISGNDSVYLCRIDACDADPDHLDYQLLSPIRRRYENTGLIAITQELTKYGQIDLANPIHSICCAVMPLTYLLLGRYLAYLANVKIWDLAGGLPLLNRCGFITRFFSGGFFESVIDERHFFLADPERRWKIRMPVVVAPDGVFDEVIRHVRQSDVEFGEAMDRPASRPQAVDSTSS